jgi:5-methylcytosine-specific restriction enzyme subunit McrC
LWIEARNEDPIQREKRSFIADTKYKIVYSDPGDPKHGISQTDLYQMVAYAMRFNVLEIKLFYPNTILARQPASGKIEVHNALAGNQCITITTHQLPIIHKELFKESLKPELSLESLFEGTRMELKKALEEALELL